MRKSHADVIKWEYFPRYWPFVRGIHRSPVNSPHKGQWRGALMFSLICAWINGWVNNREARDLRRHRAHYDVIVMWLSIAFIIEWKLRYTYRIGLWTSFFLRSLALSYACHYSWLTWQIRAMERLKFMAHNSQDIAALSTCALISGAMGQTSQAEQQYTSIQ